jgi:signal peptidase I
MYIIFPCLIIISLGIGLWLLTRSYLCAVTVAGISMHPTLQPGDRVLILRRGFRNRLNKQQIVVITPERTPPTSIAQATNALFSGNAYIKRITALEGENQIVTCHESPRELSIKAFALRMRTGTVEMPDKNHQQDHTIKTDEHHRPGYYYIKPEHRDYASPVRAPQRTQDNQYIWVIPTGYCFVMSDNREVTADSREWGPISTESILGIVIMRLPRRATEFS